jgi:hypothetical protein
MVQVGVLIAAIAAGAFAGSWRQACQVVAATFVVTSAVQTPMVIASDDIDSPLVYMGVQVLTLVVGMTIARALAARRDRRVPVS